MDQPKPKACLNCQEAEGFPLIGIQGYFDEHLALALNDAVEDLLRQGKTSLVLDFSACVAINSLAVGNLQSLTMKVVEDFRGTLVLAKISSTMARVFELASIIPSAEVAPDVPGAIARLKDV